MDITTIFTSEVLLGALLIFFLRVVNMALDTLRALMMLRDHKKLVWLFGFIETIIFVVAFSSVLQNLDNVLNIFAYAAGFGTGNVVGMMIENRIAVGFTHLQIISSSRGAAVAERLREEGYAVTEFQGRGRDGTVTMISAGVLRKNVKGVNDIVQEVDENAFITAENLSPVRRGFWGLHK
jgi:uncharacterized protein YebE (UPF0316 family)